MNHLLHYISLTFLLLFVGGHAAWAEKKTYQHIFTAKPALGAGQSLSGVLWTIAAENLYNYNSANYAGVQIGSSKADGSMTLTSGVWNYQGATTVTEVRLWLNRGGTSVTPSVTIGGEGLASQGSVEKNSAAGTDWTKASLVTFTPSAGGATGVVVIDIATVNAGYVCAIEVDCVTDDGDSGGSTGGDIGPSTSGFLKTSHVTLGLDKRQVDVCNYINMPAGSKGGTYDVRTTINGRSQKDREYACVYRWLTFLRAGRYTVHVRALSGGGQPASEGYIVFDVIDPQGAPASGELRVRDVALYIDALKNGLKDFSLDVFGTMVGHILNTIR